MSITQQKRVCCWTPGSPEKKNKENIFFTPHSSPLKSPPPKTWAKVVEKGVSKRKLDDDYEAKLASVALSTARSVLDDDSLCEPRLLFQQTPPRKEKLHDGPTDVAPHSRDSSVRKRPVPDPAAFFDDDDLKLTTPRDRVWNLDDSHTTPMTSHATTPTCLCKKKKAEEQPLVEEEDEDLLSTVTLVEGPEELRGSSNFHVYGKIGAGTFSEVFAARDQNDKNVAIKRAKRPFRTRKGRDAALKEARTLTALKTTHVVACGGAWQEDGHLYLVLELCSRGSVKHLRRNGDLSEAPTLWRFARDVASGLTHVHDRGFVHLDVKPSNVLLANDGNLKLADFGLASKIGESVDGTEGDARYLAPELLDDNVGCDPANDIFSLGMSLLELAQPPSFVLPTTGPRWRALRQGHPLDLPRSSTPEFIRLLQQTTHPMTHGRPLAAAILHHPKAQLAASAHDCAGWIALSSLLEKNNNDDDDDNDLVKKNLAATPQTSSFLNRLLVNNNTGCVPPGLTSN